MIPYHSSISGSSINLRNSWITNGEAISGKELMKLKKNA